MARPGARLAFALAALAAVGGIGWLVYERTAGGESPPPLIKADQGPMKIRPKDPGGMAVPDQDKLIYQTLDGGVVEETVERLLPPPEEPLPPPEPPAPEVVVEPPPAPPAVYAGPYMVQLSSFRSIDDADKAWRKAVKKNGDLLSPHSARVVRADLGGDKGVYYRLRIGPFAGGGEAKSLCDRLKARNVDCIVVRR